MKKLIFACVALVMSGSLLAQPIHDKAVIPVAVTVNQVLRLNVVSGGNVEFVFNTIKDYEDGITNSNFYDTQFNVASSKNFNVYLYAEDGTLLGTDNPSQSIALNNIGFAMTEHGTYVNGTQFSLLDGGSTNGLTATGGVAASKIVCDVSGSSGGDALENIFTINWECGTTSTDGTTNMNTSTLLQQSVAPDRYVSNVFLEVVAE